MVQKDALNPTVLITKAEDQAFGLQGFELNNQLNWKYFNSAGTRNVP